MQVARTTGLRTEIIVNIALLLGAALLFAGFLLVKLTERALLTQRINGVSGTMEIISHSLSFAFQEGTTDKDLVMRAASLLQASPAAFPLEAWGLADRDLIPLAVTGAKESVPPAVAELGRVRYDGEPAVRLHYPPDWLPFGEAPESFVIVTVPVLKRGEFAGALQARFSLADVRQRVLVAYKLIFLYVALYGTVLALFGIYLLNRTVVRPVLRLQQGTRQVAAGDLEQVLPVEGPREIADLADAFNAMMAALKESRRQTEDHIVSLQGANEDLKRTRDELVRSEKMASVGHLAAGMAHEIGNPLGAVVGYLEFLRSELPPGREREILERSLAETERIDRLVRDLLDYAAPDAGEAETLDPAAVLAEARNILAHQGAFAGFRLADELPPSLPAVTVARHKLLQVFVNLLLNARDASPEGGSIRLSGGEKESEVWLSVADEGAGMDPEVMTHIFDPFYTTKAPGKGRGLGLAVCHRAVEEAGGRIEVISRPGEGSRFTVWLPGVSMTSDK
jgi:signal transduction histidine kinase